MLLPNLWERPGPRPLRQASFALFIAGVLAYGAAFAWYLLDRFDLFSLVRAVNLDDSFYYFQIAWHMAGGEFSTFDGGITRTNGYHPLWLFLITPFYWVFDKTEALFAIKAFEIMLVAGGVALAAGAARAARLPWILLFAALPALYGNPALFLGLEAAAGLFLLGLFLLAVCLFARDPGRWRWPLAAVAFALPWVRLEYVAVAVAATAALCLVEWSDRLPSTLSGEGGLSVDGPSPRAHRGGWSGWGRSVLALNAAAPLSGAVAGILAYFAWNGVVFGGIVPVSAAAKRWISQLHWERGNGYSLPGNVLDFLRTGFFDYELLIALEVCVYAGLVWWFSRRPRGRDDWLLLAFLVGVFGLAAGHLAKFAQSVLTMHPGVSWRYDWYFVPAYLMEALVVPARCYVAIWFVRRFRRPDSHLAFRIPGSGIVAVGAVFLFATMDSAAPFRFVDSRMDLVDARNGMVSRLLGLMVMDRVLPRDSVVGTGGSGVMGYFSRFPVVNLDGLVNSWDYLRARKEGTAAAFLPRYGIDHLATNARSLRESLLFERNFPRAPGDTMLFEGMPRRSDGRRFWLWSVESPGTSWSGVDRAAWFWERMEPHVERQADGVGLLVDGRLAQAFARDCADEVVTWTWAGQENGVFMPWTQTSIGFCVSAVVLPHDALPPVRAATLTADEYLADRVGERRPAIDSDFDVHLVENRLVYVKEPCGPDDVVAPLFLRVYPVVPDDLPVRRQRRGYEEFRIATRAMMDAACVVEVPLPEYGIAAIRTGQHVAVEGGYHNLWEGEIRLGPD